MNKFRDRFIRAHGFLYIVRGGRGCYVVFSNRQVVGRGFTVKALRAMIKRHAIERLRACLTT